MDKGGIEYLYLETYDWEESMKFWKSLGFQLELDLGKSGRFVHPNGGSVFIEEVVAGTPLSMKIYLKGDRSIPHGLEPKNIVEDWHESHWGSHLLELKDPDERCVVVQDRE